MTLLTKGASVSRIDDELLATLQWDSKDPLLSFPAAKSTSPRPPSPSPRTAFNAFQFSSLAVCEARRRKLRASFRRASAPTRSIFGSVRVRARARAIRGGRIIISRRAISTFNFLLGAVTEYGAGRGGADTRAQTDLESASDTARNFGAESREKSFFGREGGGMRVALGTLMLRRVFYNEETRRSIPRFICLVESNDHREIHVCGRSIFLSSSSSSLPPPSGKAEPVSNFFFLSLSTVPPFRAMTPALEMLSATRTMRWFFGISIRLLFSLSLSLSPFRGAKEPAIFTDAELVGSVDCDLRGTAYGVGNSHFVRLVARWPGTWSSGVAALGQAIPFDYLDKVVVKVDSSPSPPRADNGSLI